MAYAKLKVTADGDVAVVTLADPATRNSLSLALCAELAGALEQLAEGLPAARAVVLTGEGGAFCSGVHLGDAAAALAGGADFQRLTEIYFNPMAEALRRLPMPVVAAVSGPAAGFGLSLALTADLIVAGRSARFDAAFSRIGLIPDGGATWLLPRIVGKARAMEMALLAEPVPAEQALAWGLINRCVEDAEVLTAATQLARRLAAGPASLVATRRLIHDALDADWTGHIREEAALQGAAARTDDFREGLAAFREKRVPKFRGK